MSETDDLVRKLVKSYINKYGVVRHQIESYNNFIANILPHIVMEGSDTSHVHSSGKFSHHIHFCNVSVKKPTIREADGFERKMIPLMARFRSMTYASSVVVDLVHDKCDQTATPPRLISRRVYRNVLLCRIPTMLYSINCHLSTDVDLQNYECKIDQGGYFIVNGSEKCILAQEKLRTNFPYVFSSKGGKFEYVCEVRSCHELKLRSTSTLYVYITKCEKGILPDIRVEMPFVSTHVSLLTLFRILGVENVEEIMKYVNCKSTQIESIVRNCLESDPQAALSNEELLDWIGKFGTKEVTKERRKKYLDHIFSNEILPHVGLSENEDCKKRKMIFLGHMINKLVMVSIGESMCDDRDDYANKRIDTAGVLMSLLFRQLYRTFLKSLNMQLAKIVESTKESMFNAGDLISDKKITSGFRYAFATGNWATSQKIAQSGQTGVAQILSRLSTVAAFANLRRINTPLSREGKAPKPRQLHHTSWGIVCPAETPEGASCGLVKNMAILAHVRVGTLSMSISEFILSNKSVPVIPLLKADENLRRSGFFVLVNGVIIGYCREEDDVVTLAKHLRSERQKTCVPFDTSISISNHNLYVNSDPGCLLRPVIVASKINEFKTIVRECSSQNVWQELIQNGVIEYLDKQEEETMKIAIRIQHVSEGNYTHVDIDPSLINGICGSTIPFCDHNQAPRNTYQSAMGKQAIGLYTTNFVHRMDTVAHTLMYPQRALVMTQIEEALGTSTVSAGCSPIVTIMCYTGFNQEDSVIVNQSAIDRGIFRSFVYKTYKDEEKVIGADSETFEDPSELAQCSGVRDDVRDGEGVYDKIKGGLIQPGVFVKNGDVIIGKTLKTSDVEISNADGKKTIKRDRSTTVKSDGDKFLVDAVFYSKTKDGNSLMKVRVRSQRIPQIGDKLSSRHGQKGVIGMVLNQADMPFNEDGICPDIIINPHAIPSRMTIGQLLECLLGKLCCVEGYIGDGTPFRGTSIENIACELEKNGYQRYGNEKLYNGMTGEPMQGLSFIGPTYYQRLKHMVIDKKHARSRGPKQILTQQPVEGRSRDGGLRFGEMEKDCIVSHGASAVLRERLFEQSDPFKATICTKCGLLCSPAAAGMKIRNSTAMCLNCGTGEHSVSTNIPYAFKLFLQEVYTMGIAIRLRMDEKSSADVCLEQTS